MVDERNHAQERGVKAKWRQEKTAEARAGHRQRVAETRTLFAYGARPPDGNKGGEQPALKEKSWRHRVSFAGASS